MKRKKFSASYVADSQLEYSRQANRCRLLFDRLDEEKAEERYGELGCKREEHLMIEGGRSRLRYPDSGPYKAESAKTQRRLAKELPLWDERTQSPSSGRKTTLETRIASSIGRYRRLYPRENTVGFAVPVSIIPLTQPDVKMPRRAAALLIRRAAGRFYPLVGLEFPKASLLSKVEDSLQYRFRFRRGKKGFSDFLVVTPFESSARKDDIAVKRIEINYSNGRAERWRSPQGSDTVGKLFAKLGAKLDSRKGKVKGVSFFLSDVKDPLKIDLSEIEHSKSTGRGASRPYPEYKSLNVSLSELPSLLARLVRKGSKKGRKELKEISISKENPMPSDDWYYKQQYSKSPYGSRRSLPAARRNSSIGSQMAADAMALHQETGMKLKDAWREVKAEARANGYKKARKNGGWYFGRGHGGGPKGSNLYLPDTTQTGPALVPHAPWDDGTEVFSALVPGPYAKRNSSRKRGSDSALLNGHVYATSNGQPYVKLANGQCRFISKAQAARMNGGAWHPEYSEMKGQFSTGLRRTGGTQPYARRNKKRRKSRNRK